MKAAEVPGNGSSHLIYTTLKTIESYTLKSTYCLFFFSFYITLIPRPAPILTVAFPCSQPTTCTQMVTPTICRDLAQPSPKQKQILCEPRTLQGMSWSGASVPLQMSQALPHPVVNDWATTSKICLPAASSPIFQPAYKVKLTPFQFLLLIIKRPEADFSQQSTESCWGLVHWAITLQKAGTANLGLQSSQFQITDQSLISH